MRVTPPLASSIDLPPPATLTVPVTTAAAPSAVPVDATAREGREPSCLQPGTARIRTRIGAARSTRRLYEAAPSVRKFHEVSGVCVRPTAKGAGSRARAAGTYPLADRTESPRSCAAA